MARSLHAFSQAVPPRGIQSRCLALHPLNRTKHMAKKDLQLRRSKVAKLATLDLEDLAHVAGGTNTSQPLVPTSVSGTPGGGGSPSGGSASTGSGSAAGGGAIQNQSSSQAGGNNVSASYKNSGNVNVKNITDVTYNNYNYTLGNGSGSGGGHGHGG